MTEPSDRDMFELLKPLRRVEPRREARQRVQEATDRLREHEAPDTDVVRVILHPEGGRIEYGG